MCLAKTIYERLYDKYRCKLKQASKWDEHVTQGRQFGHVAQIIHKENSSIISSTIHMLM